MYLSPAVRTIRDDPTHGVAVWLVVRGVDGADGEAVAAAVEERGGVGCRGPFARPPGSGGMDLAPGAWRLAAPVLLLAVPATLLFAPAGAGLLALGLATLWFHRDPPRPAGDGIVSPADGRVSLVREEDDGRLRVGVFMSPFSVHVNRAPRSGRVAAVERRSGAYRPAFSKDSDRNERVRIEGDDWTLVLIAGWFARRVHPYVEPGSVVARGQRVGHISYGSRADVLVPPSVGREDLIVSPGDPVRAGQTVARAPSAHKG